MDWKYEDNDDGFMGSENRIITEEKKEWTQQQDLKACVLDYEKQELGLISDIAKHGCEGGVTGIIYYRETEAFHDQHEDELWDLIDKHADEHGLKRGEMLSHIAPDPGSLAQLKNSIVWWAVEVTAQELLAEREGDS